MIDINKKIKTGYASGFLFLRFVKLPEKEELESSLSLIFTTYYNSVDKNDTVNIKTNILINLLSMYDFIEKVDNQISFSAVKNTVSKWIFLIEKETNAIPYLLSQNK